MIINDWDDYNARDKELWDSWLSLNNRLADESDLNINDWRKMGVIGEKARAFDFVWRAWNCVNEAYYGEASADLQEQIDNNLNWALEYLDGFIDFCETERFEDYRCRNLQEKYCDFLTGYRTFLKRLKNSLN